MWHLAGSPLEIVCGVIVGSVVVIDDRNIRWLRLSVTFDFWLDDVAMFVYVSHVLNTEFNYFKKLFLAIVRAKL